MHPNSQHEDKSRQRPTHPHAVECPRSSSPVRLSYLQTLLSLTCSRPAVPPQRLTDSLSSWKQSPAKRLALLRATVQFTVLDFSCCAPELTDKQTNKFLQLSTVCGVYRPYRLQEAVMADWCSSLDHVCHLEHPVRTTPLWVHVNEWVKLFFFCLCFLYLMVSRTQINMGPHDKCPLCECCAAFDCIMVFLSR